MHVGETLPIEIDGISRAANLGETEAPGARLLKVLADASRLAMVRQWLDGAKHVGEINEALGLEQTLRSHHLRVLREAGGAPVSAPARRCGTRCRWSFRAPTRARRSTWVAV
jgi:DNA-binding transcriptional ArsR family regulator